VTTAIMDDGVDYMHPDLINNFVSSKCLSCYFLFAESMGINEFSVQGFNIACVVLHNF